VRARVPIVARATPTLAGRAPPPLRPSTPGRPTTYTATSADGRSRCSFRVEVRPCVPACASPPPELRTAPGACTAAAPGGGEALSLLEGASVGGEAAAAAALPLAGPLRPGNRRVVASVRYPGGAVARAACAVVVRDAEPPTAEPRPALKRAAEGGGAGGAPGGASAVACAHRLGGSAAACFSPAELAAARDNCPGARLEVAGCDVLTAGGVAGDCFVDARGRVCLRYPAAAAAEATAVARIAAVDAAGQASVRPAAVLLRALQAAPSPPVAGCKGR
jgi:hypothetical protein